MHHNRTHSKVPHPNELLKWEDNFERKLIKKLAGILGSVKFVYFCMVLDLAMLPPVISAKSLTLWVTYLAQTVIQLLALPILQSYQNQQEELAQAKADADHTALTHIALVTDETNQIIKEKLK